MIHLLNRMGFAPYAWCCLVLIGVSALANTPGQLSMQSKEKPVIHEETSKAKEFGIDGIKGLRACFMVNASTADVLRLLWDVRLFPDLFTGIDKMTVLESNERQIDVYFEVDAVVKTARYTLRRKLDEAAGTIQWQEIGKGDVKHVRGSWTVERVSDQYSLVTYASFVDVGYAVPTGLVRAMAIRKVDELADRIRGALTQAQINQ